VGDRRILAEDLQREAERRQKARQRLPDQEALLQQVVEPEAMLVRARSWGLDPDSHFRRKIALLLISKLRDRERRPRRRSR
jgi:hypothetical protein